MTANDLIELDFDHNLERRSRLYRAQGIVLRRFNLGEADRIVVLYTREFGKRAFVSKGSRRPTSRSGSHLEPFCMSSIFVARTRGLDIITQAETIELWPNLRRSESAIGTGSLMTEMVDLLSADDQANVQAFHLLESSLRLLDQDQQPIRALLVFEMGLLRELGYRPELYSCIVCNREIQPLRNGFSNDGGIVCHRCFTATYAAQEISANAIKLARTIDHGEIGRTIRLKVDKRILIELDRILADYVQHLVGKSSPARRVLHDLQLEYEYE